MRHSGASITLMKWLNVSLTGVVLRPWKGPNPSGALLIFEDRPENFVIQNSNFWNLPSPALAVSNSTLTVSNSSFDQHLRWGPRVAVVDRASALTLTGCTFSNAYCAGDGAEQIDSLHHEYHQYFRPQLTISSTALCTIMLHCSDHPRVVSLYLPPFPRYH